MGEVYQKQEAERTKRNTALKIDSLITFKRNLGIFVNLTTNFIFK